MKNLVVVVAFVVLFVQSNVAVHAANHCSSFNNEGRKTEFLFMGDSSLEEEIYSKLVRVLGQNRNPDFSGFASEMVSDALEKAFDGKEFCPQFIEEMDERVGALSGGELYVEKGEKDLQLIPGKSGVLKVVDTTTGAFREYMIATELQQMVVRIK